MTCLLLRDPFGSYNFQQDRASLDVDRCSIVVDASLKTIYDGSFMSVYTIQKDSQ